MIGPGTRRVRETVRLKRLAATITGEIGIKLPDDKLTMLRGKLQRRLNQLGIASLSAYEERLLDPKHADVERAHLLDLATTNKTDFFREPAHFEFLTAHVLPELGRRGARWHCRVWCAGCSTGQEAYTLAMVLDDYARSHPGFDFEVIGTDISMRVLREAANATYPAVLAEPVPPALRQRYLMRGTKQHTGMVRVVPELRAKVQLRRLNFMAKHYPFDGIHIVFFRNVLIYFDRATQRQVVERQCRVLVPGGFLFIGHTESVSGLGLPLVAESVSVLRRVP